MNEIDDFVRRLASVIGPDTVADFGARYGFADHEIRKARYGHWVWPKKYAEFARKLEERSNGEFKANWLLFGSENPPSPPLPVENELMQRVALLIDAISRRPALLGIFESIAQKT
jgi:hypothetical protein